MSHAEWRSFYNPRFSPSDVREGVPSSRGFIDGDVVESFLELSRYVVGGLRPLPAAPRK